MKLSSHAHAQRDTDSNTDTDTHNMMNSVLVTGIHVKDRDTLCGDNRGGALRETLQFSFKLFN